MRTTWFPRRGVARRSIDVALAAFLLVTTLVVVPGATAPAHAQVADNPDPGSCAVDVLFILDESGSMGGTGESQVRSGVTGFIDKLAIDAADSRIGIVEFSTSARVPLGNTYYDVDDAADVTTMKNYLAGAGSPAYDASGWTNWEDALVKAGTFVDGAGAQPQFAVLITDGQPTTFVTTPPGFSGANPRDDATMWEFGTVAAEDDYAALAAKTGEIIGFGAGAGFSTPGASARLGRVVDTVTLVNPLENLADEIIAYADRVCTPAITIDKEATPGTRVEPGGSFDVSVTVTNTSATGASVRLTSFTDQVDGEAVTPIAGIAGVSCALASDQSSFDPSTPTGWIDAGDSVTCTWSTTLTGPPDTTERDTARARAVDPNDRATAPVDASATITIVDDPSALSVTKSASPDSLPEPGGDVTYTIVVSNDSAVDEVTLSSLVDSKFGDVTSTCLPTVAGVTLTAGGEHTCTFTETISINGGGVHDNTIEVTGTDDDGNTRTASDDERVTVRDSAPAMSLTKEADTPSVTEPGADVEFTITVTNDSPLDVITIDDLTDTEFDDVADTCLPTFIGSSLDPGESASCSFTEFIDAPHANTATVTATSDDDDPLEATASTRVGYRDTPASIVVTKAASGGDVNIQAPGEQVTFDVTVANASSVDAVTITSLTDAVGQGAPFDITQVAGPVLGTDCSVPREIAAGDAYDCSFTVFVGGDTGDQVTDTVTASGTSEDEQPVVDDDSETVFLDNAWRIVLNKRQCASYDAIRTNENGANRLEAALPLGPPIDAAASPVNDAWENANHDCEEVANWPFTVGYASAIPGGSGYTGLAEELSHVLDPEATVFTDANGTAVLELSDEQLLELIIDQGRIWIMEGRYEGNALTFPIEEMGFGIIRCGTDALNGDNVEFLEAADFANGDYTVTCFAYNVLEQPDLDIDKVVSAIDGDSYVDGDEARVGEEIDYTITVTNAGNVPLTGVSVSDDFVDGPLVCTWPGAEGTLAISEAVVCTGVRVATADDAQAGTFTNVSVADANEIGEPKDADATVPVVEPDAPAIAVTKAVDEDTIDRAGTVEFTIIVTNIGNTDLTDLIVDDVMTDALGGTTDLPQCEAPVTNDLAPGESTEITCEADLDVSINGVGVVNGVTATATPPEGPDVTDEATAEVTIVPPAGEGIAIDKTAGPLGTPTGSSAFVDVYQRAFAEDAVTWQISLRNMSEYAIDDIDLVDVVSPSCETAFAEAMEVAHPGDNVLMVDETIVFTCDLSGITEGTVVANEATAVGTWPWDAPTPQVSATALTLPGVQATDGSIGDTVWSDTNGNGKQDSGEKGIAGATVRLTIGSVTIDATTDANGAYLFTDLPPGTYTATLVVSSLPKPSDGELKVTTPGSFTIQLADGQAFLDADFGVVAALPTTGISSDLVALVGLMLLGAGALALMATRRRSDEGDATSG